MQYGGGTCWHALVRYSRAIENKDFTFCRTNTGFPSLLIEALFVANVAWRIAVRAENRPTLSGTHRSPRMVDHPPSGTDSGEPCVARPIFVCNIADDVISSEM